MTNPEIDTSVPQWLEDVIGWEPFVMVNCYDGEPSEIVIDGTLNHKQLEAVFRWFNTLMAEYKYPTNGLSDVE